MTGRGLAGNLEAGDITLLLEWTSLLIVIVKLGLVFSSAMIGADFVSKVGEDFSLVRSLCELKVSF